MLELLVAFSLGVLSAVAAGVLAAVAWFYSQSVEGPKPSDMGLRVEPELPKGLEDVFARAAGGGGGEGAKVESCDWFNLVTDFLFRELRDSQRLKKLALKKINKEFEDLMSKKEGKMIEQLTLREYSFGSSMPVFSNVEIVNISTSEDDEQHHQEVEIAADVDYSGGLYMAIDADLVFNKSAYVAIQVMAVKGRVNIQFTRKPLTHWAFAFYEEPHIEMLVEAQYEGRSLAQLGNFIEKKLRKTVRRKYTLPAHKMRYKPFFQKSVPQDQLLDVYVHDERMTTGDLKVEVVECSRLKEMEGASAVYCTLGISALPYKPKVSLWRTFWPVHEFTIPKDDGDTIGIRYLMVAYGEPQLQNFVLVSEVVSETPAESVGIRRGDVITKVNNVKAASVRQVHRLIQKSKAKSVMIKIERPPVQLSREMLSSAFRESEQDRGRGRGGGIVNDPDTVPGVNTIDFAMEDRFQLVPGIEDEPHAHVHLGPGNGARSGTGTGPSAIPRVMARRHWDEDSISLHGVMGERGWGQEEEEKRGVAGGIRRRGAPVRGISLEMASQLRDPDTISLNGASLGGHLPPHHSRHTPTGSGDGAEAEGVDVGREGVREQGGREDCDEAYYQRQTSKVRSVKNPKWKQRFKFEVKNEHCYLNACVWKKQLDGRHLLIGYVTIPLMDIALQCLLVSSSIHHQCYVLVAAQPPKAGASRAAGGNAGHGPARKKDARGSKDARDVEDFVGDIVLRFKHIPAGTKLEEKATTENQNAPTEDNGFVLIPNEPEPWPLPQHHRFTGTTGHLPRDHEFQLVVAGVGRHYCDICHKKIWLLNSKSQIHACVRCGLHCHKKCVHYCMMEVPCIRGNSEAAGVASVDQLRLSSDRGFAVYEGESGDDEGEGKEEEVEGEGKGEKEHRQLVQEEVDGGHDGGGVTKATVDSHSGSSSRHRSRSPANLETNQSQEWGHSLGASVSSSHRSVHGNDEAMVDSLRGSSRVRIGGMKVGAHPHGSSEDEDSTANSESDIEHERKLMMQEIGNAMYADLPPGERQAAIKKKISELQIEIDRLNEMINSCVKERKELSSSSVNHQKLQNEIEQYEDKLQPLKLLMTQHMLALNSAY